MKRIIAILLLITVFACSGIVYAQDNTTGPGSAGFEKPFTAEDPTDGEIPYSDAYDDPDEGGADPVDVCEDAE